MSQRNRMIERNSRRRSSMPSSHVRAFARSLTRNREEADDLTHDAVVRALGAMNQFTPGTNFKAWIFTILRNLYYNGRRRQSSRFSSIDDMPGLEPSVEPSQESALAFNDFRRAFFQLTDVHREVLTLVGAGGLSYEEAAAVCECRVGTVKSRVSRARAELKEFAGRQQVAAPAPPDDRRKHGCV